MHGNVWEWCLDDWHDNYNTKPLHLKQNGNEPWGDVNTNRNNNFPHVLRGGSSVDFMTCCRSAYRFKDVADFWGVVIGFRVVL